MFGEQESDMPQVSGLMRATDVAKRQPEAARALERQGQVISELQHVLGTLYTRLQPVLQSESPKNEAVSNSRLEASVPLVRGIDENTDRVNHINAALLDLIERLEV